MRLALALGAVSVIGLPVLAAGPEVVRTDPGKDLRLGVFAVFHKDCSAGSMPEIRISRAPRHGNLILQKVSLTTRRVPNCPQISALANEIIYRPNAGFEGQDEVSFDVVDPATGHADLHPLTIDVQTLPTRI